MRDKPGKAICFMSVLTYGEVHSAITTATEDSVERDLLP